jgi:hypothetical protein
MSEGASAYYRLHCPAAALQAQSADVAVVGDPGVRAPTVAWKEDWSGDHETEGAPPGAEPLTVAGIDADVVVLQRAARRWHPQLIGLMHDAGARVVVDIDDRLDCLHPQSNASRNYDPDQSPNQNWKWLDASCEATEGGEAVALRGTDWFVHNIGNGREVARGLGMESCTDTGGRVPLELYPRFGPSDDRHCPGRGQCLQPGKSAPKMSEFAAVGVPVVVSPTPDNLRVHDLGVGLLARNGAEWHTHLRRLMDLPDLRAELGGQGRAAVANQTYEHHADRWWSAWTSFSLE